MRSLGLRGLAVVGLAASVSGTPLQAAAERRAETSTTTSIVWAFATSTGEPTTTTVYPQDFTSYITLGTVTDYPFTTSSVSTSGCVTYSYQDPKPTVPVVTVTVTSTIVATVRPTVTATDSLAPPKTTYSFTASVISATTGLTVWSTSCTNTLVESRYFDSTSTYTAFPSATAYTRATATSVCMVSSTVSLHAAGGPMPTRAPYIPGISRFAEGGSVTLITVKMPTESALTVTAANQTSTAVQVVCNNPSTMQTSVWYVVTATPAPATSTVTATTCGRPGATAAAVARAFGVSGLEQREVGGGRKGRDEGPARVQARDGEEQAQDVAAPPAAAPKSRVTSTFTTVGLVDDMVVTSQATAVVEYAVQTMTTVTYEVVTETAPRPTSYVTVC